MKPSAQKLLVIFSFLFFSCFTTNILAQTKEELQASVTRLSKGITYYDQEDIKQQTFAELAYIKRIYKLDSCDVRVARYVKSLNDYYYKQFFLYSKLIDENAYVTEDCLDNPNKNTDFQPFIKILFYSLYPNTFKLPNNYIEQIETISNEYEFFSPYYALYTIYFLKEYSYDKLNSAQKIKLEKLESSLCDTLYTNYVKNNDNWNYYKLMSLKVLKLNKYAPAQNVDLKLLTSYLNSDQPLMLTEADRNDMFLMNSIGGKVAFESSMTAALWIILMELNKN